MLGSYLNFSVPGSGAEAEPGPEPAGGRDQQDQAGRTRKRGQKNVRIY